MKLLPLLKSPLNESNLLLRYLATSFSQRFKFSLLVASCAGLVGLVPISLFPSSGIDTGLWVLGMIYVSYFLSTLMILEFSFNPWTQKLTFIKNKTWWKYFLVSFGIFAIGNFLFCQGSRHFLPAIDQKLGLIFGTPAFDPLHFLAYLRISPFWIIFSALFAFVVSRPPKESHSSNKIHLNIGSSNILLNIEDIICASSEEHYLRVQTKSTKEEGFLIKLKLSKFLEKLPQEAFIQIHRSHMVNLNEAISLHKLDGNWNIQLKNGKNLPVSRRKLPEVKKAWESLHSL